QAEETYDDNCQVQREIGNRLIELVVNDRREFQRIIDLGCGTGLVTAQLANQINYRDFHAIDIADLLLAKAKERLAHHSIQTYSAYFDRLPTYDFSFDLVFSNMALQWSRCLIASLTCFASLLTPGGLFAFSIPLPGTFNELKPYFSLQYFFDAS